MLIASLTLPSFLILVASINGKVITIWGTVRHLKILSLIYSASAALPRFLSLSSLLLMFSYPFTPSLL